jgi:hypothetical protein
MALTKVTRGLLTTGIVDNSNATAITIDSSENVIIANTGGTLQTSTAGTSNFRAGVNAGNSITVGGDYNTVVGDEAGTAITTGAANTFIGYGSGDANLAGSYNTGLGYGSLTANSTGNSNTGVGVDAGAAITTGNSNVFIGFTAGNAITTGSNNTIIGDISGTTALADTIILAAGTTERMRIDSSGNVGIGTSSPANKLTVTADDTFAQDSSGQIVIRGSSNNSKKLSIGFDTTSNYGYIQAIEAGVASRSLALNPFGGNVGIGGTPARKTHIFDSANGYSLGLQQTSAYNSGNQSGIVFAAPYNAGGEVTDVASIRGGKENTTDGHYGGIVTIWTRANGGSDTERMRIDSSGTTTVKQLALGVGGGLNGLGPLSISTTATAITGVNDYGSLVIVAGNSAGNIFSDLVFYATTVGATVIQGGAVSGGPAARTYSVVGSILKLAMASGTYSVSATTLQGTL